MKKSQMPLDSQANPIPVLGFKTSQLVDGTVASAKTGVFSTTEMTVVRIACVDNVWISIGENPTAVTEQGAYFPAGTVEYVVIYANELIAVKDGKVSITITK